MPRKHSANLNNWEDLLDFAQSYMGSAIKLISCYGSKPGFKTFQNYDKAYVLAAHFLMAHGVELYLKFLVRLFGSTPNRKHILNDALMTLGPLYSRYYRRPIVGKDIKREIDLLDRYEKFRYPFDSNWNRIPDIVDSESQKWTCRYANIRAKKWVQMRDRLNHVGYRLTKK